MQGDIRIIGIQLKRMVEPPENSPILCAPFMERELIIVNTLGLHARPAAEFVRLARRFKSSIVIRKDGCEYSAASILDILSANLDHGSRMILIAEGRDATEAIEQLAELLTQFQKQEEAEGH
jgi:phosphocarrier protein HPr